MEKALQRRIMVPLRDPSKAVNGRSFGVRSEVLSERGGSRSRMMVPCSWTRFSAGGMSPSAPQHQPTLSRRAKPNSGKNFPTTFVSSCLRRMVSRASTDLVCFGARSGSLAITPTSGTTLTSGNPSCRSPDSSSLLTPATVTNLPLLSAETTRSTPGTTRTTAFKTSRRRVAWGC